jgi:hypothetical protein
MEALCHKKVCLKIRKRYNLPKKLSVLQELDGKFPSLRGCLSTVHRELCMKESRNQIPRNPTLSHLKRNPKFRFSLTRPVLNQRRFSNFDCKIDLNRSDSSRIKKWRRYILNTAANFYPRMNPITY